MFFISEIEKGLDAHERSAMLVPEAQISNATFLMKPPQAARSKGTTREIPLAVMVVTIFQSIAGNIFS